MPNIFTIHLSSGFRPDLFSEGPPSLKALNSIEEELKDNFLDISSFEKAGVLLDTVKPTGSGQLPLFKKFGNLLTPDLVILAVTALRAGGRRHAEIIERGERPSRKKLQRIRHKEETKLIKLIEFMVPSLIQGIKERSPNTNIVLFSTRFNDQLARICSNRDTFFAGGLSTDLILSTCKGLLSNNLKANETVVRTIEFPPEFIQAGVSILSYFGNYIQNEYQNDNLKVAIQQENDTISLIIETPDGEIKEKIERSFADYRKVLQGEMKPEQFVSDKLKQVELKNQLRIAALQVEQKNELLELSRQQSQRDRKRIDKLESRVDDLSSMVEKSFEQTLEEKQSLVNTLQNLINKSDSTIKNSLQIIKDQLEKGEDELDNQKFKEALANIRAKDPDMFTTLFNLMIKEPLTGSFGSFIYNVLINLAGSLPK
ncbi:hypothetical protein [Fodinibius salsisoli]|uniref:Exonuclease SbcC n=1 Tax=Fodinibius salsisoli TaxID=2820877 RepID=A0ABT3PKB5_9BACT|nr:hypothetical protein [Fodinibius salsisoli]MCW9706385.1 hypothetical protein [Fodinibius salsisoli]